MWVQISTAASVSPPAGLRRSWRWDFWDQRGCLDQLSNLWPHRFFRNKAGKSNRGNLFSADSCWCCFLSFLVAETNISILCCLLELSRLTRVNSNGWTLIFPSIYVGRLRSFTPAEDFCLRSRQVNGVLSDRQAPSVFWRAVGGRLGGWGGRLGGGAVVQLKNRQRMSGDGEAEVDKFINDNNEDEVDDNINN